MFKRVTIIGLGLIGGSLGLAIKEKQLAKEIVGVSRRKSTIRKAKSLGVVDRATLSVKKGVKGSELIILAAPVLKIIDLARHMAPLLEKGAIVIDVGSTKEYIVKSIESIMPDNVDFVGSHPLAGSEKSGVEFADKDLFKGGYCILTKTSHTDLKALKRIKRFWNILGMDVEIMSPDRHDRVISKISHLPHATSVSLANACGRRDLHLAAGGFKDTTRIASGMPGLWKDIFITNKKNIIKDIRLLKKELEKIESALKKNNSAELLKLFKQAKDIRDTFEVDSRQ